jgi:DNA topoisomerase VI subunit A
VPHDRRHGYITGSIVIADGDERFDLHDQIWIGPKTGEQVAVADHDARFVLLAEKRTIFDRLVEDEFHRKNACVLTCGSGYPGRSFHLLLRQIHDQLRLPFYVLTDNDPGGYILFFLIARGAVGNNSQPNEAIAIPQASFVGLRAGDGSRIGLTDMVHIRLRQSEIQELNRLKSSSWLNSRPEWRREIDQVLHRGTKVEMEALCSISFSCLSDTYLPDRLASGDYLRM